MAGLAGMNDWLEEPIINIFISLENIVKQGREGRKKNTLMMLLCLEQRQEQFRLAPGGALMAIQSRQAALSPLLHLVWVGQAVSSSLNQSVQIGNFDAGLYFTQQLPGSLKIIQVRTVERHFAPGGRLQDILAAMGDQAAAHKDQVRQTVHRKKIAHGVDKKDTVPIWGGACFYCMPQLKSKTGFTKELAHGRGSFRMAGRQPEVQGRAG